ncbi:MAG TPA: tetratricopeptide repeat protein [Bacteroidales bacterium]|nr:tetratricopeptide repeat protein [Bacteroidales bacterium]
MDTIENMDSLQRKIDRCVPESMAIYFDSDEDTDNPYFSDVDTLKRTMDKVMQSLLYYCPKIKEFILADKEEQFYKMSASETANKFYTNASDALGSKDYKKAEKGFIKAIKEDPGWVLPLDDIALTYRLMGEYKKAVKYYSKSLKIYPEGTYAIQNQAVAFTYLEDYERAIANYELLINLYPKNPEGFYGKGKNLFLMDDLENSLDYLFYCHKIYTSQKSEYVKDTDNLISLVFNKMKEKNQLEAFYKIAEEHGIKLNGD